MYYIILFSKLNITNKYIHLLCSDIRITIEK